MITCKRAALLDAKKAFKNLSISEILKLRLHAKICDACQSFNQDSKLIDEAIEKLLESKADEKVSLSDEQRKKILDSLD